jgi:hypothetical protein
MSGRIKNNSAYPLESVEVRLVFQDCSPGKGCETVGDQNEEIRADVPPGQSRDFEEYIFGPAISPKGHVTWNYQVLSVSAHVE